MAGGVWEAQNKVRPGVYVNFVSEPPQESLIGERGIASLPLSLSWGPSKQIVTIESGQDVFPVLGYNLNAPQVRLVREALKRVKTLLLYRLNEGVKASATVGDLTVTAKHGGVRGNDITVVVQPNIDDTTKYDVATVVSGVTVDSQTVSAIEELQANDWVTFSGTGTPTPSAGTPLTGGADGTVTAQDYLDYLAAVEVHEFHVIGLTTTDQDVKETFVAFVKRLRENEGKKVQVVVENYPSADYEGVISVKNGVVLEDGTVLNAAQAVPWVAGASAAANVNESLTYAEYDGAVDVSERYTNSEIEQALLNGEFLFTSMNGRVVVEQDINTFRSFTPEKAKPFSKNRVIRTLDAINNDLKRIFETRFIGKVDNDDDGRNMFKSAIIDYLSTLQENRAIQNFDPQSDVVVAAGADKDSVFAELYVQPTDAIEKIYLKVPVR